MISNHSIQNHWKGLAKKAAILITFVFAYLFVVIGPQAFIFNVFLSAPFYVSVQTITFVMSNAVMFGLFFYYRHKTRDSWINEEAQEFLAKQRRTQPSSWRNKISRGLLWTPTWVVLVIFLFFPETLGIASHLFGGLLLNHHRLEIPLTWIIADNARTIDTATTAEIGHSIWVIGVKGIGRVGVSKYWRKEEPVSEMTFSSYPASLYEPKPPVLSKVLARKELPFGNDALICYDIIPFARTRPKPIAPELAEVVCDSTNNDFHASFSGWRTDLSKFYDVL